jgi:hypothetical protein
LTVAELPSLFSGFRLDRQSKITASHPIENPNPLFQKKKASLDCLCNFDFDNYYSENQPVRNWVGPLRDTVWETTSLLLDFMVLYVAASLARYYPIAWRAIVDGRQSVIFGDIRKAFKTAEEGLAFFFSDRRPFERNLASSLG